MKKPLCEMTPDEIKAAVAEKYGQVATDPSGNFNFPVGRKFAESVGYEPEFLDSVPDSMWESFTGAGNPQAWVDAKPGETVLDLGCGAGLDMVKYSRGVGSEGEVIGLDLSGEMIVKAKANFEVLGIDNVRFLEAASDSVPLPGESVDLVTANGIYNLSPDKVAVMREVFRLLKPGGRTIFSEIVLNAELPEEVRTDISDWYRCIGGALTRDVFLSAMEQCGFVRTEILDYARNARTGHELAVCAVIRAEKA